MVVWLFSTLQKHIVSNMIVKDTLKYGKGANNNIEIAKVASLKFVPERLVEKKVKLLELIDIPARIPEKVELEPLEEGVLMNAYKAKIYLKKG